MVHVNLVDQAITVQYTANTPVSDGEVVGIVADSAVEPIAGTSAQAVAGIADTTAASGEAVDVVALGKKAAVADGVVNPGEPVRAAPTTGRVVSELTNPGSHSHNIADHDHTVADHDHTVSDHSHTVANHSHTAFQTDGTAATPGEHQAVADGGGNATGLQAAVDTAGQAGEAVSTDAGGPGSTDAGGPGSTDLGGPGSTDLGGSGSSDAADPGVEHGRIVGKAITSATAAGDEIEVLVVLSG